MPHILEQHERISEETVSIRCLVTAGTETLEEKVKAKRLVTQHPRCVIMHSSCICPWRSTHIHPPPLLSSLPLYCLIVPFPALCTQGLVALGVSGYPCSVPWQEDPNAPV